MNEIVIIVVISKNIMVNCLAEVSILTQQKKTCFSSSVNKINFASMMI